MQKISEILGGGLASTSTTQQNMTLPPGRKQDIQSPRELAYTCDECGSIVEPLWVEFPPMFGGPRYVQRRCQCEIQKNIDAVEKAKNYEQNIRYERYFGYSTLGKRFLNKTFNNFYATAQTKVALEKARQFVDRILNATNDEEKARGLMLIGPVGTGKSHLAAAAFNTLKNSKACIFVNVPELLDQIRASYSSKTNESEGIINAVKRCDVLILDDLGAERHQSNDDWAAEKLYTIVDCRYRNLLPIFSTTNCTPDDLEDQVGSRIMSRIREMCEIAPCLGEDYRRHVANKRGA